MSFTDQAFIKAYRSEARPATRQAPAPSGAHGRQGHHGPHADFARAPGVKRPLSQAIAEERAAIEAEQRPKVAESTSFHGVAIASLSVPPIAARLAAQCGDEYRRMMTYAARSGGVIGLLGAGQGVGCSTTTLAAALAIACRNDAPAAVIDAAPEEAALARSLGLLSCPSIARRLEHGGGASDALVYSAEQNISVGVAFDATTTDERRVSGALRSLTASHSAVLVDLGCDIESIATRPARGADSLRLDAVVLVRRAHEGEADVLFARRVLSAAGHTVIGVVESFA